MTATATRFANEADIDFEFNGKLEELAEQTTAKLKDLASRRSALDLLSPAATADAAADAAIRKTHEKRRSDIERERAVTERWAMLRRERQVFIDLRVLRDTRRSGARRPEAAEQQRAGHGRRVRRQRVEDGVDIERGDRARREPRAPRVVVAVEGWREPRALDQERRRATDQREHRRAHRRRFVPRAAESRSNEVRTAGSD